MKEEKNCPCCPNHCDINHLNCGKGREYFKTNVDKTEKQKNHHFEKDESSMTTEEKTIYKIRKCGHFLHHGETNASLNFLSEEEIQTLNSILSKCLDNWK